MQWSDIRHHYPDQWLLLEALQAHSAGNHRILDELAIVGVFDDSQTALKGYNQLHREAPARELYVFHTSRETLEVLERHWLGIRAAA
jgi:hypothetical protein